MTTLVDRIESAADRNTDDEWLADKKRVMLFFFIPDIIPFNDAANVHCAVRVVQTRWSPTRHIFFTVQETFSFTLPFSQHFRLNFAIAFPVFLHFISRPLSFVFLYFLVGFEQSESAVQLDRRD